MLQIWHKQVRQEGKKSLIVNKWHKAGIHFTICKHKQSLSCTKKKGGNENNVQIISIKVA